MELVILGAVVGAVLSWALMYFLPSRDSKKLFQMQQSLAESQAAFAQSQALLAQAEAARAQSDAARVALEQRLAQIAGFSSSAHVLNEAPLAQVIEVEANEEMEAVRLTYCAE